MDLIVMGRREESDLVRVMLGNTTAKVIGYTHSNVLVVPKDAKIRGKGIVLPVDGSRNSDAAAVTVLNFVKRCPVPVTVISVAVDKRLRADAAELVEHTQALMAEAAVEVSVDVRIGRPDEAIIACTRDNNADLIVMGSHGLSGLDRLLLGSVAERVIGRSDCPVMVVKR